MNGISHIRLKIEQITFDHRNIWSWIFRIYCQKYVKQCLLFVSKTIVTLTENKTGLATFNKKMSRCQGHYSSNSLRRLWIRCPKGIAHHTRVNLKTWFSSLSYGNFSLRGKGTYETSSLNMKSPLEKSETFEFLDNAKHSAKHSFYWKRLNRACRAWRCGFRCNL